MPSFKIDLDADFEVDDATLARAIKQALDMIRLQNTTVFLTEDAVHVTPLVDKKPFIEADHAAKEDASRMFDCFGCADDPEIQASPDVEETVRHYVPFRARV